MILADVPVGGQARKVLLHADRNGFFYTLDRATGAFISAVPFVRQTWNRASSPTDGPSSILHRSRRVTDIPSRPRIGGTNFQAPSYDRDAAGALPGFIDAEGDASYEPAKYQRGQIFTGAHLAAGGRPPWNPRKA